MRKERVDFNINIRYRFMKGPLVYNADLVNLSKGGLALKTGEIIKGKTILKIEIPLPHTSELFAVQAEVVWSSEVSVGEGGEKATHTGLRFLPMSLAKQAVINQFIQQRRDEVIMAKIGLDKFVDSVPVAGLD
jgi:c-di-GMP-binding flagellar brake protein YcgR